VGRRHARDPAGRGLRQRRGGARDFIPSTPAHGFRASPVYGILGCAATTARLLGLDEVIRLTLPK
jgi:hypothetical protein